MSLVIKERIPLLIAPIWGCARSPRELSSKFLGVITQGFESKMVDIVGVREGLYLARGTIASHQRYMWPPTPYRCPSDRSIEQEELHVVMTWQNDDSKDETLFHYEARHSKTTASLMLAYWHHSEG